MMAVELKGLEFDPGFGPHILTFQGTVDYLYMDINRFKNFSQKKAKFMQYHKKMIEILNNNLGFYIGCLMWAAYIKTQPKQKILSNHCLGQKYDEENNASETKLMSKFVELFPRDMKFFLNKEFSFSVDIKNLLNVYEEFLTINKGFVESEYNIDIKLPDSVKIDNAESYKEKIDEVLKTQDLSKLLEYLPTII